MSECVKALYILRGLPGSGKSTVAKTLAASNIGIICSADDYFQTENGYKFDASKLHVAHDTCRHKVESLMLIKEPLIIVDNTNSCQWEMRPYKFLAAKYGYDIIELTVGNRKDVQIYAERNVHGCPLHIIERMAARWEP